jgi:molybdenum cofactor cytidylyltransferase
MRADQAPGRDDERIFLSGILLAAGASTRMGRPKQLLPLAGRPLLQRSLDQAAAACFDELILVLGHRAAEIRDALHLPDPPRCRVVVNRRYREGQAGSLVLGLRSADPAAAAAAILLGDQPLVPAARIDRLARAFREAGAPAARPVYAGAAGERVPGHPVFLARSTWPELERLDGDRGARDLLAAHPDWLYEIPLGGEPPVDVDTQEDWLRAEKALLDSS